MSIARATPQLAHRENQGPIVSRLDACLQSEQHRYSRICDRVIFSGETLSTNRPFQSRKLAPVLLSILRTRGRVTTLCKNKEV